MTAKDHLYWAINSPNLLRESDTTLPIVESPSARELATFVNIDEEALAQHLSQTKSHFLGSYFEALWQFYLTHSPRYELIASNLQFHQKGKTLGELDFIAFDHDNNTAIHQEVAIKFYLGTITSPNNDGCSWIGPNAIDRLDLKVEHLRNKQLPLSKHPAVQKKLKQLNLTKLTSKALIKGFLFQPAVHDRVAIPEYINPAHLEGCWYRFCDLKKHIHSEPLCEKRWLKLEKDHWISSDEALSLLAHNALSLKDMNNFLNDEKHQTRAHMFTTLTITKTALMTGQRIFVVPDNWPASHSPPPL